METAAPIEVTGKRELHKSVRIAAIAWLLAAVYYFLPVFASVRSAVMMPQLSERLSLSCARCALPSWGSSTTDTRPSAWSRDAAWTDGDRAVVPVGALMAWSRRVAVWNREPCRCQCGPIHAGSRRSFRAGRGGLYCHQELSGLSCRYSHRRDTNVRHGGGVGGSVRRRSDDRGRVSVDTFWTSMGVAGLMLGVLLFLLLPQAAYVDRVARTGSK